MPDPKDIARDAPDIVQNATAVIKKVGELTGGSISITIDSQSKEGNKDPKDCECPNATHYHRKVMSLTHRALLQRVLRPSGAAVRLSIGIRWQGNGCDVIGAMPYLGSDSMAGYGTAVTGTIQAVESVVGRPQQVCGCCQRATCVEFSVALLINPLIGATVIRSGHIIVCANGEAGAEWQ